jgi:hypothetical protein
MNLLMFLKSNLHDYVLKLENFEITILFQL